jgi:MMPL family
VPIIMGATSVLSTFPLVLGLTTFTGVSMIVEFLIGLIGLGIAFDYSLLVVTRWREERAHGRDNIAAVEAAMAHAGRAVVFSGLTVAVGLLALIVLPVPMLRASVTAVSWSRWCRWPSPSRCCPWCSRPSARVSTGHASARRPTRAACGAPGRAASTGTAGRR